MSAPHVTIVVPAHRYDEHLLGLLRELDAQVDAHRSLPVVVVDDSSPEPLAEALREHGFERLSIDVVRTDANVGPGGSRNRGLERVRTPWVAFIDSDEVPSSGWLQRLEEIVAFPDAPDAFEGRVEVPGVASPFTHVAEATVPRGHRGAGNVAFRSDVLRAIGGFSERFYDRGRRLHFREDTELFFRFEASGLRSAFRDDLVVLHPPLPPSFAVPLREARRYFFDPLLSREYPAAFGEFVRARRIGPIPLRRARHQAALVHALGAAMVVVGTATGRRTLARAGGLMFVSSWAANGLALSWGRNVPIRLVPRVAAAAAITPWIYLWHYYRGCLHFRHLPRL